MQKENNRGLLGSQGFANLNRLAYFAAVVETGSFTAAAERLGVTKAVVSQQVARLEREFRNTLLIRSTRRVSTTEIGQAFYYRCAVILKEAEDAFAGLAESASEPAGTLRLTAPFDYGIGIIVPAIAAFSERYPACKVQAQFSDHTLDLNGGDIDLAIRVGWLTEQHVQARQIGRFEQRLVAAASWHQRLANLETPAGLVDFPLVANTALRDPTRWTFTRATQGRHPITRGTQEQHTIAMKASLYLNATLAVREAALAGAGLAVLPDYAVDAELAAGRLIAVLPQWRLPSGDIHAVFPSARYRPAKVRAFIDLLSGRLGGLPSPGFTAEA